MPPQFPRSCSAPGCAHDARGYSPLCSRHRHALSRHGHQEQTAVTVHELRPYLRRVQQRHHLNAASPAWSLLTDRWSRLVEHANGVTSRYQEGQSSVRHEVEAARQVHNLATVPALDLVFTYSAMFLLQDARPHRFKTEKAFNYQLVRRIRGLTSINAGNYYCHKEGRSRRVYRDLPPRAVDTLALWLRQCFGSCGLQLARLEQEPDREAEEQRRLTEALAAMR